VSVLCIARLYEARLISEDNVLDTVAQPELFVLALSYFPQKTTCAV
jgi:hypothetical protein